MPIDYVTEIAKLAEGTARLEQPTDRDWKAVEAELGLSLPDDYKALVSCLGEGDFGCGLHLRNPCSSSEYARLSRQSLEMHREPIRDLEEKLNFPLYPSTGGAVHLAGVDRQDFYLKPDSSGRHLGAHLVWLDIDTEEVRSLNYTVPRFIHDLYRGLIREPWAEQLRAYFWLQENWPFFKARPGRSATV